MGSSNADEIRHDWYQTDSHVVISVMLKQMKPEDVRVEWTEKTLTCRARLPDGIESCLHLDLSHEISKDQCTWKVLSSKIEIKLTKAEFLRWEALKADKQLVQDKPKEIVTVYPTSTLQKKDWDKLAFEIKKEEEEEKLEGDAALNQMFQKIYSDGSDDIRKAMNKSFLESGGTVLSTNWKEVVEKKVDIKPPDGMEWKKWE